MFLSLTRKKKDFSQGPSERGGRAFGLEADKEILGGFSYGVKTFPHELSQNGSLPA